MPIKFRCPNCRQFLGISRAKAGSLTDCPTCGHTIRVPKLDGTVDPVPKPGLDLQDAGLVRALDALADLKLDEAPGAEPLETERAPVTAAPRAASPAVVLAAPGVARPISVAVPSRPASPVSSSPKINGLEKALSELEGVTAHPAPEARSKSPSKKSFVATGLAIALGSVALGGVIGFGVGRATVNSSEPTPSPAPPVAEKPPVAPPETPPAGAMPAVDVVSNQFRLALTGRVTYTNDNGESRADDGARILAFPEKRLGTGKIPVVGFRAGAGEADYRLSKASLRSVGGDFAKADSQGRYELSLPGQGPYQVLIISRYQNQKDAAALENTLRKTLEGYFDRPNLVIGQVKHHFGAFRFDGEHPTTRDHGFVR
jgi:hypothetical protein